MTVELNPYEKYLAIFIIIEGGIIGYLLNDKFGLSWVLVISVISLIIIAYLFMIAIPSYITKKNEQK